MRCDACGQGGYKMTRVLSEGVTLYVGACCGQPRDGWAGPGTVRPAFAFVDWSALSAWARMLRPDQVRGRERAFQRMKAAGDCF